MLRIIKKILYVAIFYSRVVYILRYLYNKLYNNPVKILYTHRIIDHSDEFFELLKALDYFTVEEFKKKIKYLLRHYRIISLEECITYEKEGKRPTNCVVLTFDDGYKSVYKDAFPILKRYNIPATVFVTTESIDKSVLLWHDKLLYIIGRSRVQEFSFPQNGGIKYKNDTLKDKVKTFNKIVSWLKKYEEDKKIKFLQELSNILQIKEDEIENSGLMITWNEAKEMHASGLVEFGAHTVSHPILTKVSTERVEYEIRQSKAIIEQKLVAKVKYFAYPNGDYNQNIKNMVKKAGYSEACTTYRSPEEVKGDIFALSREGFTREPFYMFALKMAGVLDLISRCNKALKYVQYWLPGYISNRSRKITIISHKPRTSHVFVSICDHFEPLWSSVSYDMGLKRVQKWVEEYPKIAKKYVDTDGLFPKYTFFYPIEEYRHEYMALLANLCHQGFGEVEIHLHHDNDYPDNLRKQLINFKTLLADKYKLLSRDKKTGEIKYGFIHGNWALDNSRPDGRWCGINNELQILEETGCYADFTMPSIPDVTQTRIVNSIYYAIDDPDKPKSHNKGTQAEKGKNQRGLLMVQGPLMLNWKKKKWRILPKIENGLLSYDSPVDLNRIKLWIDANIHVKKAPEYLFIKLYTHGCQEKNTNYLFGDGLDYLFSFLQRNYNNKNGYKLHYVTAREMVNVIKAVEDDVDSEDIVSLKEYRLAKI